jgi:hypothetical protein
MSTPFYDLASMVVLPSGYKSGKIYAQKPLTTDGQLTFTRASTATRVNASGLIETVSSGVPRLDYQGSTCPKLLLEPQRTNLLVYSDTFSPSWNLQVCALTQNAGISPDGTNNAVLTYPTADTSIAAPNQFVTVSGSTVYTQSIYVKAAGKNIVALYDLTGSNGTSMWVNLTTGAITNGNLGTNRFATNVGNGWWRIGFTQTSNGATAYMHVYPCDAVGSNAVTKNGTDGILIWGSQIEQGSYATSKITTTSAAVTRVVETAEKTGISSLIGQPAGSFYFEYVPNDVSVTTAQDYIPFAISDGTSGQCLFFNDYNGNLNFYIQSSGTQTAITFPDLVAGNTYKIAVAYNTNDVALYVNGVLIGTDSVATMPTTMSKLQFNGFTSNVHVGSINVKQTLLFKTRLTNAQLAELTTL